MRDDGNGWMKGEGYPRIPCEFEVLSRRRWVTSEGVCTSRFLNFGVYAIFFIHFFIHFFGMLALGYLFQCETRELLRLKNVSEED